MADWQAALRARLLADEAVAAIVEDRVTWVKRPDRERLPAITLQLIADHRDQHMDGFQATRSSLVQIDGWADGESEDGHETTYRIAEAVIAALAPKAAFDGGRFLRSFVEAQRDMSADASGQFIHRVSIDLTIWHSQGG